MSVIRQTDHKAWTDVDVTEYVRPLKSELIVGGYLPVSEYKSIDVIKKNRAVILFRHLPRYFS